MKTTRKHNLLACALVCALAFATSIARAADLAGSVQGAAKPIAGATVTLYVAGTDASTQLSQAKTDDQGAFRLTYGESPAATFPWCDPMAPSCRHLMAGRAS